MLQWTPARDNKAVTRYKVLSGNQTLAVVTGESYTATGLSPAVTYRFKVEAVDASGNCTTTGPTAVITLPGPKDKISPVIPEGSDWVTQNRIPGSLGTTWAAITWGAATDNIAVAAYRIIANDKVVAKVNGSKQSFTVGALRPATAYTFKIQAVDGSGNTVLYHSVLQLSTLPGYDTGAPQWPKDAYLVAERLSRDSIRLKWNPARDDREIAGYRVYQDGKGLLSEGDHQFTPVNQAKSTKDRTFIITGLTPGQTYRFKVEAGDATGKWSGAGPELRLKL
jgi:exo-poly-alpha-galacturonosidase